MTWMPIIAMFLVPMAVLCGPIWLFGRKRVSWTWVDFSVSWFPFIVWFGLMWMNLMPKSLSNFAEALLLGVIMPLCPALRLFGKHWMEEIKMAWATAALGVVLAIGVYFITPYLPDGSI